MWAVTPQLYSYDGLLLSFQDFSAVTFTDEKRCVCVCVGGDDNNIEHKLDAAPMNRWVSDCRHPNANISVCLRNSPVDDLSVNAARMPVCASFGPHWTSSKRLMWFSAKWCDDTWLKGLFGANAISNWDKCHVRITGAILLGPTETLLLYLVTPYCEGDHLICAYFTFLQSL